MLELHFYTERPGGYFAWKEPLAVEDADLRYGRDTEVLRIATAGSSYQLVAPCEFHPLIDALEASLPPDHMAAWQMVREGMSASLA